MSNLMPKRVKFRKEQRGKLKGNATRGNYVAYGDYGLQSLEPHWLSARQIDAGRIASQFLEGTRVGATPVDPQHERRLPVALLDDLAPTLRPVLAQALHPPVGVIEARLRKKGLRPEGATVTVPPPLQPTKAF